MSDEKCCKDEDSTSQNGCVGKPNQDEKIMISFYKILYILHATPHLTGIHYATCLICYYHCIYCGYTNITSNSHNTTNNMTNNIININNYGDENTKYITSDYILKLLKNRPAKAIPELIKYTHFNDAHPENHNIKITNKKEPYIKVRKNDKWELQDKDATITDLIDRQQIHLLDENVEKKIEDSCSNTEKNNIERCSVLYNNDDKDYMKKIYNESELVIINNS